MYVELSTSTEAAPVELLDVQVQSRPEAGRSLLSVQFLCRRSRAKDATQPDRMKMPPLTWLDASRLQQFTQQVSLAVRPERYQVDLPDAGLRLISSSRTEQATPLRAIRVEPLPDSVRRFTPFVIKGTAAGLGNYARMLYQRLWEAFCRG